MKDVGNGVAWRQQRSETDSQSAGEGWLSLDEMAVRRPRSESRHANWRAWRGVTNLWLTALRAGGLGLWREAEFRRRTLFAKPALLSRFVTIGYASVPAALHEELAWLRGIGIRDVVLPIDQGGSEAAREKALTAVRNLRTEDCRIGAVLREKPGAEAHPEAWREFCVSILSQTGWLLERAQIGGLLNERAGDKLLGQEVRHLFAVIPKLRVDYPGVAFLPPDAPLLHRPAVIRALYSLLPAASRWDGLSVRLPAETQDGGRMFLLHLALIGAVANRSDGFSGNAQVCFASPGLRDGDVPEAIMGTIVKRAVLAIASGIVKRTVIEVEPIRDQLHGAVQTTALKELVAHLEGARFMRRLRVGDPGRDFVLEFHRQRSGPLLVAWTEDGARPVRAGFRVSEAHDVLGRTVPLIPFPRLRLTETLSYFIGE